MYSEPALVKLHFSHPDRISVSAVCGAKLHMLDLSRDTVPLIHLVTPMVGENIKINTTPEKLLYADICLGQIQYFKIATTRQM